MNAKSRAPVWLASLTIAVAAGLLIVGVARSTRWTAARKRVHSHRRPQRPGHRTQTLSAESRDPDLVPSATRRSTTSSGAVADEQIIPPAERRAWEVNGLRVGRIIGDLPLELEAILKETAPQKKVNSHQLLRG